MQTPMGVVGAEALIPDCGSCIVVRLYLNLSVNIYFDRHPSSIRATGNERLNMVELLITNDVHLMLVVAHYIITVWKSKLDRCT